MRDFPHHRMCRCCFVYSSWDLILVLAPDPKDDRHFRLGEIFDQVCASIKKKMDSDEIRLNDNDYKVVENAMELLTSLVTTVKESRDKEYALHLNRHYSLTYYST